MDSVFEHLAAWWRARTGREQLVMQGAMLLIIAVLVPAWLFLSASDFRRDSAAELASMRQVELQVAQLAETSAAQSNAPQGGDASLNGRVLAAAEAAGLRPAQIAASAGNSVRVSFEPADSVAVYRWIAMMGAGGAHVTRTAMSRVADSEMVIAEFDVSEAL